MGPVRTLVAWCPDWPVVALGRPLDEPVAVVHANRVVASSPAARHHGVVRDLRRRVAQSRCAELEVLERDEAREARTFEPVLAALDDITPRVEVTRPGTCAIAMRGPSRYFGGDEAVATLMRQRMGEVLDGRTEIRIGIADGPFAAGLAARAARPVHIVADGGSAAFLAPMSISVLDRPELTDVLVRLGLRSLGAFAELPPADVLARFGDEGRCAHRLASGLDERPPDARLTPPDWSITTEIDPPADRIDRVAFCARGLADELHQRLEREGVSCVRIAIEAETEFGETLLRLWRHEGALSAGAIADRVRWQLDGWLNGSAATRPSGGISRVTLLPDEIVPAKGRQLGFWGGETEVDERAARVAARLQGQLGADAVKVPERRGGRHPGEQLVLVSASTVELRGRSVAAPSGDRAGDGPAPWPGRLPAPSPSRVPAQPRVVELLDGDGEMVTVTGRGMASGAPVTLGIRSRTLSIVGWAGPWPVDERWWDTDDHRRRARFQLLTDDGQARLVTLEQGRWWVTALWD
ncbi:MAG: DNA polymerase Y family protein [Acidimicrobiales bacterium]